MGDLGAEVIKIESRARPCLSRLDVQVAASRAGDFDDKPWFAHLNTSKRSVALDLKRPGALVLLQPLIDWADVVVENFLQEPWQNSASTMTRWCGAILPLSWCQAAFTARRARWLGNGVWTERAPRCRAAHT